MNTTSKIEKVFDVTEMETQYYSHVRIVFTNQVRLLRPGVETTPRASRLILSVNVVCAKILDAVEDLRMGPSTTGENS